MNIRPKVTVDYKQGDLKVRHTIAPNDNNPEWTVFHERALYDDKDTENHYLFTIPNDSLNDFIRALTIYRDNLNQLNR